MLGNAIRRIAEAARRGNTAGDTNVAVAANVDEPGTTRTSVRTQTTRTVQRDAETRHESQSTTRERGT